MTHDGPLVVTCARNLDRRSLEEGELRFSRGIAERVVRTSEPVVTVDASQDARFADHRSVHAMRITSVCAVPIASPSGVLGAIYLDQRHGAAAFRSEDVDLLVAFADQVAISLVNARLHRSLRRRTEALQREQARVRELLDRQTAAMGRMEAELRAKQAALENRYDYRAIVGESPAMRRVFEVLDRIIGTELTVLVQGESGTGKELVARAVHFNGPRKEGPFVALNCGALPANLLEAELFGHVRGAFTGATRDRAGLLLEADGGTLFLDELGEMPRDMQVKLLRVLQEREVRPVGAERTVPIDVRVVCGTNRDLKQEVAAGRFREDLYYRVAVVDLRLAPLRERAEDIPLLAEHFLSRIGGPDGDAKKLSRAAAQHLSRHAWPGNVRELENVLTKAALLSEGDLLQPEDLDLPAASACATEVPRAEASEAARVREALDATGWNVKEAARRLGLSRATMYRRLRRFGIERSDACGPIRVAAREPTA